MSAAYPAHHEATIVLRDGSTLDVRPIRQDDEANLARFFTDLFQNDASVLSVFDSDSTILNEAMAKRLFMMAPLKYRAVDVRDVARVLVDAAKRDAPGVAVIESAQIPRIAK